MQSSLIDTFATHVSKQYYSNLPFDEVAGTRPHIGRAEQEARVGQWGDTSPSYDSAHTSQEMGKDILVAGASPPPQTCHFFGFVVISLAVCPISQSHAAPRKMEIPKQNLWEKRKSIFHLNNQHLILGD
jgi:hypothetical protein